MIYTDTIEKINLQELRALYPQTAFPSIGPSIDWLYDKGLYRLNELEKPIADWDKIFYEDGVEEDSSGWVTKWSVRDKTQEELDAYFAEIAHKISQYRESLELTIKTYEGHSSYCNKESETGLNECINNIMDSGGDKEISWQGPNGYTVSGLEALSGLRKNVVDYRQKTRDAERLTLEDHANSPFTNIEDAIEAFNEYMEGENVS